MQSVPACPRCADGGAVLLSEVPNPAGSVFKPLPKGEPETVVVYRCSKCGWSLMVPESRSKDQPRDT